MKIKSILFAIALVSMAGLDAFSQSLQNAKQELYYDHNFEAQKDLKALTSPDDLNKKLSKKDGQELERIYYYLGVAQANDNKTDEAVESFQAAEKISGGKGLGLAEVGLGKMKILDKNYEGAKQDFQKAWDISKGRDMEVLREILKATAKDAKADASFALSLLDQFKDDRKNDKYDFTAEDYSAIGDVYAHLPSGGGKAATNFEHALNEDPHYAKAAYHLGNLWDRARQDSLALLNWKKAVSADSKFAPAIYELYVYYSNRDVDEAMKYLRDYMALADDKLNARQYLVDLLYLQKNYQEAIDSANVLMNEPIKDETKTRLYKLIGVSKMRLDDMEGAKESFDTYFDRASEEERLPFDYMTYATIMDELGDKEQQLVYLEKYVDADTTTNVQFIRKTANDLRDEKNYNAARLWYKKLFSTAKDDELRVNDYYNRALSDYRGAVGGEIESDIALNSLDTFIDKYPDQISGHILKSDMMMRLDTGLVGSATQANEAFIKAVDSLDAEDAEKQTSRLVRIYNYEANVGIKKEDFGMAEEYASKLLELDANDPNAANIYGQIALVRLKEKNLGEAEKYANKALQVDSDNTIAPQVMDYVKQMRDYQKKKDEYEKAKAAQGN